MQTTHSSACQQCEASRFSRLKLARPAYYLMRLRHYLASGGRAAAWQALCRKLGGRAQAPAAVRSRREHKVLEELRGGPPGPCGAPTPRTPGGPEAGGWLGDPGEVLGLLPGELVEVKSDAEIRRTLDGSGAHRGLQYQPGMRPYCGRRFRVHRRVERMFLEESRQVRSLKNTVLLAGVHCGGEGIGCDRQCFYFWREIWLRRASGDPGPGEHS